MGAFGVSFRLPGQGQGWRPGSPVKPLCYFLTAEPTSSAEGPATGEATAGALGPGILSGSQCTPLPVSPVPSGARRFEEQLWLWLFLGLSQGPSGAALQRRCS